MALEALLAPVKAADRHVLKYYTRISQDMQDSRLYWLCQFLIFGGHPMGSYGLSGSLRSFHGIGEDVRGIEYIQKVPEALPITVILCATFLVDYVLNNAGIDGRLRTKTSDTLVINPILERCMSYTRIARFPYVVAGASFLGKAADGVMDYITSGQPPDDLMSAVAAGVGLLAAASSMYLKDRDPKLLDKKPFWQRAYDWVKERFVAPKPAIEQASPYTTLEDAL